jgi:hypothetical protein
MTRLIPPVRRSTAAAQEDLLTAGLCFVRGAAPVEEVEEARARLVDQAAAEDELGCAFRDPGDRFRNEPDGPNQRVWNLINKGAVFGRLALNPLVSQLVGSLLGPEFLLFSFTANIARLGGRPQPLHGDQVFVRPDTPYPVIANCLWMLDDFTPTNGATRVVPGSHTEGRWPRPGEPIEAHPATGPRGTIMVWDGRLWHGTGANETTVPRHGLLAAYCAPFIRQQENATVSTSPGVLANCSDELRALLGFRSWAGLGSIDSADGGVLRGRPVRFSTELRRTSSTAN